MYFSYIYILYMLKYLTLQNITHSVTSKAGRFKAKGRCTWWSIRRRRRKLNQLRRRRKLNQLRRRRKDENTSKKEEVVD
jgi:hypothetical protein